jgi:hypothetical protein
MLQEDARKNQVASRDIYFTRADFDRAPRNVLPETRSKTLSAHKNPDRGSFRGGKQKDEREQDKPMNLMHKTRPSDKQCDNF